VPSSDDSGAWVLDPTLGSYVLIELVELVEVEVSASSDHKGLSIFFADCIIVDPIKVRVVGRINLDSISSMFFGSIKLLVVIISVTPIVKKRTKTK
jgi:hypothetical protein